MQLMYAFEYLYIEPRVYSQKCKPLLQCVQFKINEHLHSFKLTPKINQVLFEIRVSII